MLKLKIGFEEIWIDWDPKKLEENQQRYTLEAKNLRENIGKFENLMSETKF